MSLVGSLEDLGLGEILQIIHLSRKSGVLTLRSESGEGQVVFSQGLIRGILRKGAPGDLGALVVGAGLVSAEVFDGIAREARDAGVPVASLLAERCEIGAETLDELRRDHVESAVLGMFEWPTGEFSFEVRDVDPGPGAELFLDPGLNPQFLVLEGTRQLDEQRHGGPPDAGTGAPALDGAILGAEEVEPADGADGEIELGTPVEDEPWVASGAERAEPVSGELATSLEEEPDAPVLARGPAARPGPIATSPAVVVIDPELPVLEWVKSALEATHPRIHIFQHSDLGIARIRQYLARAEVPLVMIAADAQGDALSGARDCREIVRRLKTQVPRMPILLMVPRGETGSGEEGPRAPAEGFVSKPTPSDLADARRFELRERCAETLRQAVARAGGGGAGGSQDASADASGVVAHLREVSARIRDPRSQGEVLRQVLDFAARLFRRVALFMVCDGRAVGIAQAGLARGGGPEDAELREVEIPCHESTWLRRVLASRAPLCAAPVGDGDHRLAVRLGSGIPDQAYLAPIESSGEVVVVLYADNLPGGEPLGDTSALEVVLHQAGLALDRAVLERALAEAEA